MEDGAGSVRVFVAAVTVAFLICAAAAPALAQANAQGGNVAVQIQYCPQVVQQYASANQSNSGAAAAIAQNLGISQNAVNACIQNAGSAPAADRPAPTETAEETTVAGTRNESIVLSTDLPKTLANTGGDTLVSQSASATTKVAMLVPAGALLVVAGGTMFCLRRHRA
jgi:hypothetical protein